MSDMDWKKIRQKRRQLGLTQDQIADKVGISTRQYQNYESEKKFPRHKREIVDSIFRHLEIITQGLDDNNEESAKHEQKDVINEISLLREEIRQKDESIKKLIASNELLLKYLEESKNENERLKRALSEKSKHMEGNTGTSSKKEAS